MIEWHLTPAEWWAQSDEDRAFMLEAYQAREGMRAVEINEQERAFAKANRKPGRRTGRKGR